MTADNQFLLFLEYQKKLSLCSNENREEIILNDSIVHAVLVFSQLLEKAVKDSVLHMKMYCGELSLLRQSTKIKVEDECKNMKPSNSELIKKWEEFKPYEKFITNLNNFFNAGGVLSVIIDNQNADSFESEPQLWNLKQQMQQGRFIISQMPYSVGLTHFAFVGNSYRCENSDLEKTALCSFNSPKMTNNLERCFNLLSNMSLPFSLERVLCKR